MHEQDSTVIDFSAIAAKRSAIEQRLGDGYVRIEQAVINGEDVAAWEAFWCDLLVEYEALSNELSAAA